MKLRNVRLFMVLLASLLMLAGQPVAAVGALQSESKPVVVEVSGQKVPYFSVSVLSAADKLIKLSINELRFLKAYSKKADAQKHFSSAQNVLLPEIKSIVAAKKSASLGIIAPNEYDSAVILFSFDAKGVMTYAIYGTEDECPEWLLPTVAASVTVAQKSGFSWLTITGIVAGATAAIAAVGSYLNNLFTDEIGDIQDFARLQSGQLLAVPPTVHSLEEFIAKEKENEASFDIFVDGTKIRLRLSKTISGLFQSDDYGPIINRVFVKYRQDLGRSNLGPSGLIVQNSRILFKLPGTGTYDITTILFPSALEVETGFVPDLTSGELAELETERLLNDEQRREEQANADQERFEQLDADAKRERERTLAAAGEVHFAGKQLFFKDRGGHTMAIHLAKDDTLEMLNDKVVQAFAIDKEENNFKLIANGVTVTNIAQLRVFNDATLHLVLSHKGRLPSTAGAGAGAGAGTVSGAETDSFTDVPDREIVFAVVGGESKSQEKLSLAQKEMSQHCREHFLPAVQAAFGPRVVAAYEMAGHRYGTKQEDRIDFKENGDYLGFAVYDGHNGAGVSQYLVGDGNLLARLLECVAAHGVDQDKINKLYATVDDEIMAYNHGAIANNGSTAVILVINKKTGQAWFINLGDSRAVLLGNDTVLASTTDHEPKCVSDPFGSRAGFPYGKAECICPEDSTSYCELKRIIDAGGFVRNGRVGGAAAFARAFGDKNIKCLSEPEWPFKKLPLAANHMYPVSIFPEITEISLADASTLVIACDGIFEEGFIKNADLSGLVRTALASNYNPAHYLCFEAATRGSSDNISCIVVPDISQLMASRAIPVFRRAMAHSGAAAGAGSGAGAREGAGEEERKDPEEHEDLGAGSFDLRSAIADLPQDILNRDGSVNFSHSKFNAVREKVRAEISQKTNSLEDIKDEDLAGLILARGVTDEIGRLNRIEKSEAEQLYGSHSFLETVGSYFAVGTSGFSGAIVASQALMSIEDISQRALPLPWAFEANPEFLNESLKAKLSSRAPGLVVICADPGDVPWFKDNNVAQSKGIVVPRESGIATMYVPVVEKKNVDSFGQDFIKQAEMCKALDKAVAASLLNGRPIFFDSNSGINRSTTILQFYLKKLCPEISWRKINAWVAYHRGSTQTLEDAFSFKDSVSKEDPSYGYGAPFAVRDLIVHDFKQRGLLPESYNIYASEVASSAALPLLLAEHSVGGDVAGAGIGAGAGAEREVKPSFADSLKVALSGSSKKLSNDELKRLITERDYSNAALTESEKTGASGNLFDEIHNGLLLGNWEYTKDLLLPAAAARLELSHEPKLIVFVGSLTQKIADTLAHKQLSESMLVDTVSLDTLLRALEGVQSELKRLCSFEDSQSFVEGQLYSCQKDDVTILYLPMSENSQAQGNVFVSQFVPHKDTVFRQIDHFLADGKSVLIHCMEGCNRSMAITTAYLHEKVGDAHSFKDIISFIASKRAGVKQLPDLFTAYKVTANRANPAIGPCLLGVIEHYLPVTAVRADLPVVVPAGAPAGAGSGAGAREGAGEEERKDPEEHEDLGAGAGSFDLRSAIADLPEDILNQDGSVNFSHERFNEIRESIISSVEKFKTDAAASFVDYPDETLAELIKTKNLNPNFSSSIPEFERNRFSGTDFEAGCTITIFNAIGKHFFVSQSNYSEVILHLANATPGDTMYATGTSNLCDIEIAGASDLATGGVEISPNFIKNLAVNLFDIYKDIYGVDKALDEKTFTDNATDVMGDCPEDLVPGLGCCLCQNSAYGEHFKDKRAFKKNGVNFAYVPLKEESGHDSFTEDFMKTSFKLDLDKMVAATLLNGRQIDFGCNSGSNRSVSMLCFYLKRLCPDLSWYKLSSWVFWNRAAATTLKQAFQMSVEPCVEGLYKKGLLRYVIAHDFRSRELLPADFSYLKSYVHSLVPSPTALPLLLAAHYVGGAGIGAGGEDRPPLMLVYPSFKEPVAELSTCSPSEGHLSELIEMNPYQENQNEEFTCSQTKESLALLGDSISAYSCQGAKGACINKHGQFEFIQNEDALDVRSNGDWVGFAVYDGHSGGRRISDWLAVGKDSLLVQLLSYLNTNPPAESVAEDIKQRFALLDTEFWNKYRQEAPADGDFIFSSGSTAGICLYNKNTKQGYFIVLGDSQPVVVLKSGDVITLNPHKTNITNPNGTVQFPMDHAFGDYSYKKPTNAKMSVIPMVLPVNLSDAEYIAVCSDGVYEHDRVKVADTGRYIQKALASRIAPAEYLCRAAFANAKGIFDHTTAIVLDVQKYLERFSDAPPVDSVGSVSVPEVPRREVPLAGAGAGPGAGHGAGEYSEDLGRRPHGRRSEPSTRSVELARIFNDLESQVRAYCAGKTFLSNEELWDRLSIPVYPVRDFPAEDVLSQVKLAVDQRLPFHKIVGGLYLGNNALTNLFMTLNSITLDEINNVAESDWNRVPYLDMNVLEEKVAENLSNPQAMDKKLGLVIALDNKNPYSKLKNNKLTLVNGVNFFYLPLDEKSGDDFNDVFLHYKDEIFALIDETLGKQENVLIHCHAGNHRSASIMLCYLYERLGGKLPLHALNGFIRSIRSNAMSFKDMADRAFRDDDRRPTCPSPSNMLFSAMKYYCSPRK